MEDGVAVVSDIIIIMIAATVYCLSYNFIIIFIIWYRFPIYILEGNDDSVWEVLFRLQ